MAVCQLQVCMLVGSIYNMSALNCVFVQQWLPNDRLQHNPMCTARTGGLDMWALLS
jgi:hypothetical protein